MEVSIVALCRDFLNWNANMWDIGELSDRQFWTALNISLKLLILEAMLSNAYTRIKVLLSETNYSLPLNLRGYIN